MGGFPSWFYLDGKISENVRALLREAFSFAGLPDLEECAPDEELEFSWNLLMPFIKEGEVLVAMESGAEAMRYIGGYAEAFVRRGNEVKSVSVSLHDIYKKAASEFGVDEDAISVAEY